jgi:hypothetical protein
MRSKAHHCLEAQIDVVGAAMDGIIAAVSAAKGTLVCPPMPGPSTKKCVTIKCTKHCRVMQRPFKIRKVCWMNCGLWLALIQLNVGEIKSLQTVKTAHLEQKVLQRWMLFPMDQVQIQVQI